MIFANREVYNKKIDDLRIRIHRFAMELTTKEEIEAWMTATGRTRLTLADELGVSKGTVDNWLSQKGFPLWSLKAISRIATPTQSSGVMDDLKFSHSEWMEIEKAMKVGGYSLHHEFYHDVIMQGAQDILEKEQDLFQGDKDEQSKVLPLPKPNNPAKKRTA